MYAMVPGTEEYPTNLSWRFAARFCNWLHNDQSLTQGAFESGAYDTSTFTTNPDGTINDQAVRSPGARFWIPSENEWIKATYYDPNRYGPGQDGYWLQPAGHTEPLISGDPDQGGETSAGTTLFAIPVGLYATRMSLGACWILRAELTNGWKTTTVRSLA